MLAFAVFAVAALLALLEARRSAYESHAHWQSEVRISLVLGAGALAIDVLLPDQSAGPAWRHGLVVAPLVFLADDLLYYVSHRLAHRVHLFWASHAVHHSPVRYNLFTGLRQPPTWLLTPAAAAPVLLLALGAPAALVAASASLRALHHFLIHTERVRRLPSWIEFVFNTPSHHRVHHSNEVAFLDKNYGGVLIVWDRLFGTFCSEPAAGVRNYGLVRPIGGGVWRTLAEPWRRLFAAVGQAPSRLHAVRRLLAPPSADATPAGYTISAGQVGRQRPSYSSPSNSTSHT